jgi:phenylalanyl-tRNA synthetase alpha chain
MLEKLEQLQKDFLIELDKTIDEEWTQNLQKEYIWKKWKLNNILKNLKNLNNDEKKIIWPKANQLKNTISDFISKKELEIKDKIINELIESENIDVTAEFPSENLWHKHPLSITSQLLEDIFISLWFKIEDWPQVEIEDINFNKLNIPDNHPARDVWDTFWINDEINKSKENWQKYLLRTHTSSVQIRAMLKWELPIKIIVPWRVFRYEQEDARHTCNFYQLEWLVVWEKVSFWDLKWTLETAMKKLLWDKTELRFRPSIFPFTEPSAEIDISCQLCKWTWLVKW